MTKQEQREKQIKDLKDIKKKRRSQELTIKVVDKMTDKVKGLPSNKKENYVMKEAYLIAYELGEIEKHGLSDATVNEIIHASMHQLIFLVNKENYTISTIGKGMPYDYYDPETVKFDTIKAEINRVLASITPENCKKLRKKIISDGFESITNDLKALYDKDMSIFELFSNYKIQQYLTAC